MNQDTNEPANDEGSDAGHPPGTEPRQEVARPEEDERQERGRAAMNRWSLHKTFMEDLEAELEAQKTSDRRPPDPDPTGSSNPSLP